MRSVSACLIFLALAGVTPAAAQDLTDSGDYWTDTGQEERRPRGRRGGDAQSLEDAEQSGRSYVLGSGYGGSRTVPETYTVVRGDTLWDVTGRFYGNPWEWPRVWSYNPEITNPHWIYPMDRLRLIEAGRVASQLPTGRGGQRTIRAARSRDPESVFLRDQGYLDRDALRGAGYIAGSPDDHMLLAPYDECYVQFGENSDVRAGQEYTVFRQIESQERDPEESGTLVRIFGTVLIRGYDREQHVARAVITEALDPIERGMRVAAIPRRFDDVPPQRNQVDIDAQVVATLRPQRLVGQYNIIFVNAGGRQGVRPGNRFFIVRQGDDWRQNLTTEEREMGATVDVPPAPEEYPAEVVAEARVVHVRENTATLMVTRQVDAIAVGDRAEMRRGY